MTLSVTKISCTVGDRRMDLEFSFSGTNKDKPTYSEEELSQRHLLLH